jgi:hypothetical protein
MQAFQLVAPQQPPELPVPEPEPGQVLTPAQSRKAGWAGRGSLATRPTSPN